ncbi:MAG: sensor domain-containing diguanylate cyclase [Hydrogenovibrio sp.]
MTKTTAPTPPELETLFDHLADAIYLLDPETSHILWCNRAGFEDLGYNREEVLNHSVLSLQKDVVGQPQWDEMVQVIQAHKAYTFVGRHRHKNGGDIAVEVVTTHFEHQGKTYFLSSARNVNKRLAFEKDLQTREDSVWFALNEALDGLWEWDIETDYVFFSPQLKKMLGYGPDEMAPNVKTWTQNIHPDDLQMVLQAMQDYHHGIRSVYEVEYRLRNRNGHYLWVHDRGKTCQFDAQNQPLRMVGMVQDITDRKHLQFQLEDLAAHDVLTQLPNRREGEKQAQRQLALAKRNQRPMSLAVVDFDDFKNINDMYGHQKGDDAIVFGAQQLENALRETDIIYRWGGEEFVIIFPNTPLNNTQAISEKLHRTFREADWRSLGILPFTLSIGIAGYPENGDTFAQLFAEADKAVFVAKETGRDQTILATDLLETGTT